QLAAMQLSYDADMEVRAYAGQALALLAFAGDSGGDEAAVRVVDLMSEDGLMVPYRLLGAMSEVGPSLPRQVIQHVEHLRNDHPSRLVRLRAEDVLRHAENGGVSGLL